METTPRLDPERPLSGSTPYAGRDHGRRPIEALFGPVDAPRGSLERRLLVIRSVLAYLGTLATVVQVVVWLLIGLITEHLDSPWWLWTAVPAGAGVALLTLADRWRGWWNAQSAAGSVRQGAGR